VSFRYELACKGHSTEKAQDLVTQQNDLYLKQSFFTIIYAVF